MATMFVLGALAQNPKLRNGKVAMTFFLNAGKTEGR
jgi:hypothetical protein